MAGKSGSFVRNLAPTVHVQAVGAKLGPNGVSLVSTGFADLDKVLGGGIPVGGILMIMEDIEAPHHLLLLRYFMAQGLVHDQPLLYASPLTSPQAFLGTLPGVVQAKDDKSEIEGSPRHTKGENLRIAWQYRKYFNENHSVETHKFQQPELAPFSRTAKSSSFGGGLTGNKNEFCSNFDLRKPIERSLLNAVNVECVNLQAISDLSVFHERCTSFLSKLSRAQGGISQMGRIAIQSLCAPQCRHSNLDWEMLSFLKSLKAILRVSNAVAMITCPSSLLTPFFCTRWQHLADIVLSVKAIPDEDKELASLLTDYQDMIGFVHVHKLTCINTQVPTILEANTYSLKLLHKKVVVLERLNQAPVDASSGESYGTVAAAPSCSRNRSEKSAKKIFRSELDLDLGGQDLGSKIVCRNRSEKSTKKIFRSKLDLDLEGQDLGSKIVCRNISEKLAKKIFIFEIFSSRSGGFETDLGPGGQYLVPNLFAGPAIKDFAINLKI